jgi:hypothetical protein
METGAKTRRIQTQVFNLRAFFILVLGVVTYFWFLAQKRRKCKKIKNVFGRKIQKNIYSEKRMPEHKKMIKNWLRRFKNTKNEI